MANKIESILKQASPQAQANNARIFEQAKQNLAGATMTDMNTITPAYKEPAPDNSHRSIEDVLSRASPEARARAEQVITQTQDRLAGVQLHNTSNIGRQNAQPNRQANSKLQELHPDTLADIQSVQAQNDNEPHHHPGAIDKLLAKKAQMEQSHAPAPEQTQKQAKAR